MEPKFTIIDDVFVCIAGSYVGALTDVRYEISYEYNPVTGPDMVSPFYDIEISYRPMIGIKRLDFHFLNGVDVVITDPWNTVSFGGCKTRTLTNRTDSFGMVETIRLTGYRVNIE